MSVTIIEEPMFGLPVIYIDHRLSEIMGTEPGTRVSREFYERLGPNGLTVLKSLAVVFDATDYEVNLDDGLMEIVRQAVVRMHRMTVGIYRATPVWTLLLLSITMTAAMIHRASWPMRMVLGIGMIMTVGVQVPTHLAIKAYDYIRR